MSEQVYQHVVSKGGESYTLDIGIFDDFEPWKYLNKVTNNPMYPLIPVMEDEFMAIDHILKLEFERMEVH